MIGKIWRYAISNGVPRRSLLVALVVGTILNLINQGDAMLAGLPLDVAKLLLTYLVPYLVSTYGAVSYRFHADEPGAGPISCAEERHQLAGLRSEDRGRSAARQRCADCTRAGRDPLRASDHAGCQRHSQAGLCQFRPGIHAAGKGGGGDRRDLDGDGEQAERRAAGAARIRIRALGNVSLAGHRSAAAATAPVTSAECHASAHLAHSRTPRRRSPF